MQDNPDRAYKRRLYRTWTRLRRIKPWYFLVLAVISAVICVFALRANNLKMVELRQAVYAADEANGDVEAALRDLREHVYGHMNTSLAAGKNAVRPPIQLKFTYERLLSAQQAGLEAARANNGDLYNQAQEYCESALPEGFSGSYRISCISTFIKQRSAVGDPTAAAASIPKSLYQFDFRAAKWSPDLAGWSMVATALFTLLAAVSYVGGRLIRQRLR